MACADTPQEQPAIILGRVGETNISEQEVNEYFLGSCQCDALSVNNDSFVQCSNINITSLYSEMNVQDTSFVRFKYVFIVMMMIASLAIVWVPYIILGVCQFYWTDEFFIFNIVICSCTAFIFVMLYGLFLSGAVEAWYNYYETNITVVAKEFLEFDCCDLSCRTSDFSGLAVCSNITNTFESNDCGYGYRCSDYSSTTNINCEYYFNDQKNEYEEYCSTYKYCKSFYENRKCYNDCGSCFGSFVQLNYTIDDVKYTEYEIDSCSINDVECANEFLNEYDEKDSFIKYYYPSSQSFSDTIKGFDYMINCRYSGNDYLSRCTSDWQAGIGISLLLYFGSVISFYVCMIIRLTCCRNES